MSEPSAAAVRATVERGAHDTGLSNLDLVNALTMRYIADCYARRLSYRQARELGKQVRDALEFAADDYAPKRGWNREAVAPDRERSA